MDTDILFVRSMSSLLDNEDYAMVLVSDSRIDRIEAHHLLFFCMFIISPRPSSQSFRDIPKFPINCGLMVIPGMQGLQRNS